MSTNGETPLQWKTTIIVSTSMQNHDISRTLSAQQHRIRFSDSVEPAAFVFPLSGTAFLVMDSQELPNDLEESGLLENIQKFVHVHRNSFLLMLAPFFGKRELDMLAALQYRVKLTQRSTSLWQIDGANPNYATCRDIMCTTGTTRFFGSNLKILPVRNNAEIVKGMLTIAKATTKPHVDSIRDHLALARARIIENSPVWETLRDIQLG